MTALTVLMPVHNAEKFLAPAMESILQQTFTDFEFLIIDDGSTDQSVPIIKSYLDARIRFVQNKQNLGISATLNKGIELASGEVIARMDADDISYPERLQKQHDFLCAHPDCAMVSSMVRVISEEGKLVRQDSFKSEHFYYNLTFICWIYHPTVMYRKQAVKEVGCYTVPFAEDFELFWQLSRRFKFYNLPEVLLDYRETAQSLHQVLKKQEYLHAQQQQILRNIHYYTGSQHPVPLEFIDCYQHRFSAVLAGLSTQKMVSCLRFLDVITQCILKKENVNRQPEAILKAAQYKKRFIAEFFLTHLPWYKKIYLLKKVFSLRELYLYYKAKRRDRQVTALQKQSYEPLAKTARPAAPSFGML